MNEVDHLRSEKQKNQFLKLADVDLHRDQLRVVNVIRGQAKCDSADAELELSKRISNLPEIVEYIRDQAPITINLSPDTIKILTADTHYRSTFETNTKGDNYLKLRHQWETECFHDLYNKRSMGSFDRPKYGALNWLNAPDGIPVARQYGTWFITLVDDKKLRNRITLASGDTSGSRCIGVLDYCNHVLATFANRELTALSEFCKSSHNHPKYPPGIYKEVQIHGELQLDRDIASLHVDVDNDIAQEFCKKFNIELVIQSSCLH